MATGNNTQKVLPSTPLEILVDYCSTVFIFYSCSLHYATVTLGTPGMKFLVALDTGSDLFWVPCDCSKCASIEGKRYSSVSFCFSIENLVVNRNHACCYA